jgi:urease accessory protein
VSSLATLLILADGRLPAGGHAHSGGLETAVTTGRLRDVDGLSAFLRGRLGTTGRVAAAFAAAACTAASMPESSGPSASAGGWARISALDGGMDARTPSPALRRTSRAQGRALLRAGRAVFPVRSTTIELADAGTMLPGLPDGEPPHRGAPAGPHHPVALGLVAAVAGLSPVEAAVTAAYGTITAAATAAVRLLGLDPYAVHALLAGLAGEVDRIGADAADRVDDPVDDLPADSAPLLEIGAEIHASWEVRLFAS